MFILDRFFSDTCRLLMWQQNIYISEYICKFVAATFSLLICQLATDISEFVIFLNSKKVFENVNQASEQTKVNRADNEMTCE